MNNHRSGPLDVLVVSGALQIAAGAVTGFPHAAATYQPALARRLGIRAPGRVRQLHLDLIMMGGLSVGAGAALPGLPRAVALPLMVSSWTNALAFGPLAVKPGLESAKPFRAAVATSFVVSTLSWIGVAGVARHRWAAGRRAIARQ